MPVDSGKNNQKRQRRQKVKAFLLAISASLIWGVVPVIEKLGLSSKTMSPAMGVVYRSIGAILGAVVLFLFLMNDDRHFNISAISVKGALALASAGILASVVAQVLFYAALKQGDVSRVLPIVGSYPLVSFVLGVLLLGEALTLPKAAGALLVVGGVVLLK